MVLVKAKRDEILGPLSAVSGIIERRHTLPILSNVLIERVGGKLSFLATDIEIQITAKSGLEAAAESHSITVGARKLLDILRALPDSAEVILQQQDKKLVVKAGRSRFSLQSLPAEDFPRLAKPSGEAALFKLEQRALRRLLSLVQYAMAQQDIRYYLNGLLMVVEDRSLKLVATDGHRLALAGLHLGAGLPRQEVTGAGKRGRGRQSAREPRRQALLRAAILSNEKFRGVRWVLGEGSLKLVSSNAEQEEAHEEMEVKYSGDALDIGFNVNYLLDVLNNVPGAEVECAFGDASSSALISYASEKDFKYVVMPMRI